jgi:O-antigen biosynthesis protein
VIVAFTDDDVIADPQWLSALASNFVSDAVGCTTGLILPAELDTRAQYWTERHGGFGKGFERRVFDLAENRPSGALFPFAAGSMGSGANMAFRTRILREIGIFDAALGAGTAARGGDDLAAFVSVIRAGYQLVYEPAAIVWHRHRRSEAGMQNQAYGYGVGLGAYLTKFALEDPSVLLHYLKALPAAAAHLLNPASDKNARLPDDYPVSWKWRERLGILAGIPAYLKSRAAFRTPLKVADAMLVSGQGKSEPVGK